MPGETANKRVADQLSGWLLGQNNGAIRAEETELHQSGDAQLHLCFRLGAQLPPHSVMFSEQVGALEQLSITHALLLQNVDVETMRRSGYTGRKRRWLLSSC